MNYDDWLAREHDAYERLGDEEERRQRQREEDAAEIAAAEAAEEAAWLAHCSALGLDPETGWEVEQ